MGKTNVTIYDIAREAGVSTATVSRVLSNSINVKNETKKKITDLIEKYDYHPNAIAKRLAKTKSNVLGIMVYDISNPFYSSMFIACEKAANSLGYSVILSNSMGSLYTETQQLKKLLMQRVDAIIQFGGHVDACQSDEAYTEKINLVTKRIPVVISGKLDGTNCYQVKINDFTAMDLAFHHLLDLGHREIAIIGGNRSMVPTFDKYKRFEQLIAQHHLPYREEFVNNYGSFDDKCGYDKMNQLYQRGIVPTAIIAINDFVAAGVMRCVLDHKQRIPEDISVVSFDNTFISEIMFKGLTSVDYNYEYVGGTLTDVAIKAISGIKAKTYQLIEPSLVVRNSTGQARK